MPAVTVDDLTRLERIPSPNGNGASRERSVRSVTTAPRGFEGEGFPVRRAFAGVSLEALDPFVHLDQIGEVEYAPGEPKGTPWHPHRGFETVTYMMDGVLQHQDSNGGGGLISNGDTQWMTAGRGILHIETPPEYVVMAGGLFHGLQLQESRAPNLELLLLGGRPIREPVAWMGPFVMNTEAEVREAIADFQAGRLGRVPEVHGAPDELAMQVDSSLD